MHWAVGVLFLLRLAQVLAVELHEADVYGGGFLHLELEYYLLVALGAEGLGNGEVAGDVVAYCGELEVVVQLLCA